ncbi:HTH-type transcriptional regulator ZntR [compost metagenome]|jgi:Cd(II)/Pb(II)-responsive transcriptional regulator|uniref:Transcriptional regulator MerR family n=2 Tax=Cupriavidus necator TaxID=106590 RepID=G0F013_CUPNN|nr:MULTISPECIES: Cd(II)/Pb(II)-responsive transcriptional regulator [Cupriavidus]AEI78849.1 transcriptional regulator MerR family [Cupriavidus necator N-1]KAI3597977.1 Transcriptional regulator, MerR family [Cupriavidus necator H850]KUE86536.1 MerR family transcriptional regulator [Cupriavidus necator]MDX6012628.1 Cd(II)/Pb(II)-responsive transcriptional regulator [Cupriavidus necator]QQX84278.1 Cd(II)/Pb(II)-responsive transcriptional regulator [Cupriavidus necator]
MRIGELSRTSGCDVETIRYYEREGLLDAPRREANGYRRYDDGHLVQLNFVRHCRSLGMGLSDVRRLREFERNPSQDCDDINTLLDRQIAQIHAQRVALEALEGQLRALRETCHHHQPASECGILQNLQQAAAGAACECHAGAHEAGHAANG